MNPNRNRIPKARIFVVNEKTRKEALEKMEVSALAPSPKKCAENASKEEIKKINKSWLRTITDIASDMLQMEIGDYIFLWERIEDNASKKIEKSTIYGVYRVISDPYYINTDRAPFKIKIDVAYKFEKGISEYDILNNPFLKKVLWNIIGKKVAGKARASSPLTFDEVQCLIEHLIDVNNGQCDYIKPSQDSNEKVNNSLEINLSANTDNPIYKELSDLVHPNTISYVNEEGGLWCEKVLEGIFNQEMRNRNKSFFDVFDIDVEKVVWFSNYLPYSIERSEMDYLIMTSGDGFCIDKIFLIEFQITPIDKDHIKRTLLYTKWINEMLAYGKSITQPILIGSHYPSNSKELPPFINDQEHLFFGRYENSEYVPKKKLLIFSYSIENGKISFSRQR